MESTLEIGIVGDWTEGPHARPTQEAIGHAADALGKSVHVEWVPTAAIEAGQDLSRFDGLWGAPGSPYTSLEGALLAIRYAREHKVPFIGTCAGFQHAVLEYARNVLGLSDAVHAEYDPGAIDPLIAPLACSLVGKEFPVRMCSGSLPAELYGRLDAIEHYYCQFGVARARVRELEAHGLRFVGVDDDGEPRILVLDGHPFFLATLFVPQAESRPDRPHPLVVGFLAAAVVHRQIRREIFWDSLVESAS